MGGQMGPDDVGPYSWVQGLWAIALVVVVTSILYVSGQIETIKSLKARVADLEVDVAENDRRLKELEAEIVKVRS